MLSVVLAVIVLGAFATSSQASLIDEYETQVLGNRIGDLIVCKKVEADRLYSTEGFSEVLLKESSAIDLRLSKLDFSSTKIVFDIVRERVDKVHNDPRSLMKYCNVWVKAIEYTNDYKKDWEARVDKQNKKQDN